MWRRTSSAPLRPIEYAATGESMPPDNRQTTLIMGTVLISIAQPIKKIGSVVEAGDILDESRIVDLFFITVIGLHDHGEQYVQDLSHLLHLALELIDLTDEVFVVLGHVPPVGD
jgi:hypothetical protein